MESNTSRKCQGVSSGRVTKKRGRPTGHNRIPLSKEERKARNALYERERRNEHADAMAELADAMQRDRATKNAELLQEVILYIKAQSGEPSLEDMRRQNELLQLQLDKLSEQLSTV